MDSRERSPSFILNNHGRWSVSYRGKLSSKDESAKQRLRNLVGSVRRRGFILASLKIPERFKPGIAVLAQMPETSYQSLLEATKRAPKTFTTVQEFEAWVAPEVTALSTGDLRRLIDAVASMRRLLSKYNVSVPKLVSDITEAARASISNFEGPSGTDFAERLGSLLSIESFDIIGLKARELQGEAERTFCDARVITDVRPIYGETVEEVPTALLVVHTLKLVFHDISGHREFYLALDEEDISSLKKSLDRAEEKARSLKTLLAKKDLRTIELSSGVKG